MVWTKWYRTEHEVGEELYLAGEKVRPGVCRRLGGHREVYLEKDNALPASLDGGVACYPRLRDTWIQIAGKKAASV